MAFDSPNLPQPHGQPRQTDRPEPRVETIPASTIDPSTNPKSPTSSGAVLQSGANDLGWQNLDRHELLSVIGEGGMGVVYEARQTALGRLVALKMIGTGLLSSPDRVARFYREATAAARVRHRHILPILGVGLHEGRHCFTMPLLPGGSLSAHLKRYRQDRREAVALVEKVARAVHALHEAGVVHRDLKPANILLDEEGEPLVADFGLAKLADGMTELTISGQRMGTPSFMSPEQTAGHNQSVGPASDIWSLGVILYELLVGCRPFTGSNPQEVSQRILHEEPPFPCSVNPDVPVELAAVVLKCLEKEPAQRYSSAAELADDLARWRKGERVTVSRPGWLRRIWRAVRRHPKKLAGVFLLVATALTAAGLAWRLLDTDHVVKAQQRQLLEGKEVVLIGDSGRPTRVRWAVGEGSIEPPRRGEAFAFHTFGMALLELLPAGQPEQFRLRAEVQHVDSSGGFVGVWALHQRRANPQAVEHLFFAVTFSDHDRTWLDFSAKLCRALGPEGEKRGFHTADLLKDRHKAENKPGRRGPWRRLAIEVRPERIDVFWEGQKINRPTGNLARPTFGKLAEVGLFEEEEPRLDSQCFPPDGALGLIVQRGRAAFRNVVVEPLPE